VGETMRGSSAFADREGSILTIRFELFGQQFVALNFPSDFKFTEAVSFVVDCKDQAEVDYYWDCLSDGGEPRDCGWVKDRFGVFWQITPTRLIELMSDPNPAIAARAATAMMTMQKIDIAALERAVADG
ncbi:MAG TPA: hypothetical protein DCM48_20900, partial [Thalassospira sp.]|nr:hypothetical protein [Thalassospira sp.]